MKTELAMGPISKVAARGGEHAGKGKPARPGGFDEALAAKAEKRMPQDRRADRTDEARPQWRIGGIGERLALVMPRTEKTGDAAPDLHDDLRALLQPAAADTPARDDADTPDDILAPQTTPKAERDDPAMPQARAAAPSAELDDPPMPEDDAGAPAALQVKHDPQPVRDDAAPARQATTPAVAAASVTTVEAQPRPRDERGQPARSAPATDAAPADDGDAGTKEAVPRGQMAAVTAAVPSTEVPPVRATLAEPAPERRQPAPAARESAKEPVVEPAARQAPPATPQPDAATEQRAQRPAAAVPRAEAPAADRAGTPAPQVSNGAPAPVTVLGVSTAAPMPVMPVQLNPTVAGLVAAIEAEPTWRAAAAEAASTTQRGHGHGQGSISTLRIQLNPAELGMVTARLTVAGPQLEIEIRVESNDARQRLAADGDAIVKALRALGYDIDKVTIQQAPQGGPAQQQQGGQGRDAFPNGQGRERADANAGGRNGRDSESGTGTGRHGAGEAAAERRPGGGVYI